MAASTRDLLIKLPTSTILETRLSTTTSGVPALTTVLNLPSSCLADIWLDFCYVPSTSDSDVISDIYDYVRLGPRLWDSNCFPLGYSPETTDSVFYSPGVCPQSYIQACSSKFTAGTVTETQAICCPTDYSCQKNTDWPWRLTNQCVFRLSSTSIFLITNSLAGPISSVTETATSGYEINAYGISIRYQSSDFVSAPTKISSSSTSPSTAATTGTSPPTLIATSAPETNHPSGLSSGAGAGIGVGVTIAVFALVGSGLFYFFRRRRSTSTTYEATSVTPMTPTPPTPPSESHDRSELVGSQVYTEHEFEHIPRQDVVTLAQPPSHSDLVRPGSGKE
ncbi:uncharacterized protein TRUGW13939_05556 [Talaromyces rugulosus]|uniref:Mid2 domain-containing protein n=1 Tax=Talaromyces rugulosus TaxID=121627 RepID=A0A7H8QWG5_TALRU|nr:uncharacterized protein TRUGW13939_05556 [Talaromyces rugulosus]QKX58434.1 hypothetical protein TRUGW13939_05556 [Talaromyces rugulosus]